MGHGGSGHGLGRVGVRYLVLVALSLSGALALAWHFDLGTAATAVTVLLGLAPAYLAWAAFRADRTEAAAVDLDTAAEQLAVAVKSQWDDEAAVRRVNDPYPLPVAWRAADDDLAEPWPLLRDLARAWPGGPPGDPASWPEDSGGLADRDAQIGAVFTDRVPTRRLLILGEPGAGKSVLLIRLLQDLVERRTDRALVPVLFSLASWNPRQPMKAWLAAQLRRTYPGLRSPAPTAVTTGNDPGDLAQALLDAGRILPLLDGFDELPPAVHATALDALNRSLSARQPLVLASRVTPYRAALRRPDTVVRLNGAAAIELLPLAADAAAEYLRRDAGGPHAPAADGWDAIAEHLGTGSPAGQALSTPLGLFLARTIYNPRPQAVPGPPAPHSDELCNSTVFSDRAAVDTHLFNAFVPAAYTRDSRRPPHWTAQQAARTLIFIARFLQNQHGGTPDLAWWELYQAVPVLIRRVVDALIFGIVSGVVVGIEFTLATGVAVGLPAGLISGSVIGALAACVVDPAPGTRLRWSPRRIATGFLSGLTGGFILGFGAAIRAGLPYPVYDGLGTGCAVGLMIGVTFGLKSERPDLTTVIGPVTLLSSDRRTFVTLALAGGCGGGLVGVFSSQMLGVGLAIGIAVPGIIGLTLGLGFALTQSAWPHYVLARTYLAVRHRIPLNLMEFLHDAHEHRGVLRQVGAVYQFRHIDLQRHLARR